jgi:hypothetical protein
LCISLFPDVKSGVARATLFEKKRDRGSGAAPRSREKALPGKKGKEGENDARRMRIMIIVTRSVGKKFLKKSRVHFYRKRMAAVNTCLLPPKAVSAAAAGTKAKR